MKRYSGTIAVAVLAGVAWIVLRSADGTGTAAELADIVAGETLYQAQCAVCHGENLEGQPNWRSPGEDGLLPAPPHDQTGHTWHHGDQELFDYTWFGGAEYMAQKGLAFDSGMPGFGEVLTAQEIRDILAFIKSTWPARIQDMQRVRTQAEAQQRGE